MARYSPKSDAPLDGPSDQTDHGGPDSGGQSGDTQGLSQAVDAAEESVGELATDGQSYEAQILKGVGDATDHRERPVHSHEGRRPAR